MKRLQILMVVIVLGQLFSSCYRIVFSSMGILDSSAPVKQANNSSKEIVYIPMHHIGKRAFYNDVKDKIDSLRKLGFVFYYEGVKFSRENDSLKNDTLSMKLRKLIGVDFRAMKSQGGYIDTLNNTLMGLKIKSIAKYKLVNQPKYTILFDTITDRRVDVYLSDALSTFEKKFGSINLTDCDFTTKYNAKYSCGKYKGEGKKFITEDYRNDFIANEILKDGHTKIALVYGAKHFDGILKILQKQDSTWKSY